MSREMPWLLGRLEFGSDRLREALRLLQKEPFAFCGWAPELSEAAWLHTEQAFASPYEIAAIRWRMMDRASKGKGAELARSLREAGYLAVSFPTDDRWETPAEIETLKRLGMEDCILDLEGRIYLVPAPSWTAEAADTIAADIAAQHAADLPPDEPICEWRDCRERVALFDECDRLATAGRSAGTATAQQPEPVRPHGTGRLL